MEMVISDKEIKISSNLLMLRIFPYLVCKFWHSKSYSNTDSSYNAGKERGRETHEGGKNLLKKIFEKKKKKKKKKKQ